MTMKNKTTQSITTCNNLINLKNSKRKGYTYYCMISYICRTRTKSNGHFREGKALSSKETSCQILFSCILTNCILYYVTWRFRNITNRIYFCALFP